LSGPEIIDLHLGGDGPSPLREALVDQRADRGIRQGSDDPSVDASSPVQHERRDRQPELIHALFDELAGKAQKAGKISASPLPLLPDRLQRQPEEGPFLFRSRLSHPPQLIPKLQPPSLPDIKREALPPAGLPFPPQVLLFFRVPFPQPPPAPSGSFGRCSCCGTRSYPSIDRKKGKTGCIS